MSTPTPLNLDSALKLAEQVFQNIRLGASNRDLKTLEEGLSYYKRALKIRQEKPYMRTIQASLEYAANKGYDDVLKTFITNKVPVDLRLNNNSTALIVASTHGHVEAVRALLKCKADPDLQNDIGMTALIASCSECRTANTKDKEKFQEIVDLLLKHKAGIHFCENSFNSTALTYALIGMDLLLVQKLLNAGATVNKVIHKRDWTALHFAVKYYSKPVFNLILERKELEVDALTNESQTALSLMINLVSQDATIPKETIKEVVVSLLNRGAKLHVQEVIFELQRLNSEDNELFLAALEAKEFDFKLLDDETKELFLRLAAQNGYINLLERLLENGVDIESKNDVGGTALHIAAQFGQEVALKVLLKHNANINSRNIKGNTPIFFAAYFGHLTCVQILLEHKPELNIVNVDHKTLLFAAMQPLQSFDFERLKTCKAQLPPKKEETIAAILKCLLEAKADPNLHDGAHTPLMEAIITPVKSCIPLLIEKSNLNLVVGSYSALHWAAEKGDNETIKLLLSKKAESENAESEKIEVDSLDETQPLSGTPIVYAALNGHFETVELLLAAKASVNPKGSCTPLIAAAQNGHAPIVKHLLSLKVNKVNIEARDINGRTALIQAVKSGNAEIVDELLKAGADPNAKCYKNITALMAASYIGHGDIMKRLIGAGALLYTEDYSNMNSCMYACINNQIGSLAVLHEHGCRVNEPNSKGIIPIMYLLSSNQREGVRFMIETAKVDLRRVFEFLGINPAIKALALLQNWSALAFAGGKETYDYLRSLGFEGTPLRIQIELYLAALEDDLKQIEECLTILDVNDIFDTLTPVPAENKESIHLIQTIFPLFTSANHSKNPEIFSAILRNKLYSNYKEKNLSKDVINAFVKKLVASGQDFSFTFEGGICFTLIRKGRLQPATLLKRGEEALLGKCKSQTLSQEHFIEELLLCTEESFELKAEAEKQDILKSIIEAITKGFENIESSLEKLGECKKILTMGFMKDQAEKVLTLENACLNIRNRLRELLKRVENPNYADTADIKQLKDLQQEIKLLMQRMITEKIIFGLQELHKIMNQLFKEHSVQNIKELQKKHKQNISKENKRQDETLNLGSSAAERWLTELATIESVKERIKKQPSKVVQRGKTAPAPKFSPDNPLLQMAKQEKANQKEYRNMRQYLTVPERTFGTTTQIMPRLKTKEAVRPLIEVVAAISTDSAGTELQIDYLASLGAIAQALETRKDLSENWPNKVRNVIFHFEESLRKLGNEPYCIKTVKLIFSKLQHFPESLAAKSQGQIEMTQIEHEDFLKKLNDVQIPKASLQESLILVQQASNQLIDLQAYLVKNYKEIQEIERIRVVKMAIGFALTRIGTALNDIRKINPSHAILSSPYGKYIPLGNAYRHNDPEWDQKVTQFIEDAAALKPIPSFTPLLNRTLNLEEMSLNVDTLSLTQNSSTLSRSNTSSTSSTFSTHAV